jgi:hypothetical protein
MKEERAMVNFSAGPWKRGKVEHRSDERGSWSEHTIVADRGRATIAAVFSGLGIKRKEAEANIRVTLNAPELFLAFRRVVQIIERDKQLSPTEREELLRNAHSLLRETEGR